MARFDDEAKRRAENERRRERLNSFAGFVPKAEEFDEVDEATVRMAFNKGYSFGMDFNFEFDGEPVDTKTFFSNSFDGYNLTTKEPRKGFIDGGIILKAGFTLTDKMREDAPVDEWNVLSDFIDRMANLVADPILERKLYHVYDAVPVITTMEK